MTGKRVHERFERRLRVVLQHGDRVHEGVSRNVSLGGMFIVTEATLPFGAQVKVRFRLPALKEDTEVTSTVRWNTPEGVGIQFGSLRAMEVWALNQLFKMPGE